MKEIVLTFLFLSMGCAGQVKHTLIYPNIPPDLKIVVETHDLIMQDCSQARETDNGLPITPDTWLLGCYVKETNTIYSDDKCPENILHELGHASGLLKEVVAGIRSRC